MKRIAPPAISRSRPAITEIDACAIKENATGGVFSTPPDHERIGW
ncbi:hypothetical protein NP284_02810 [Rhodopseudomonas pseudopalustris]